MMLSFIAFGMANWQETQRYIDEDGGPPNLELTKTVLPYARIAMILYTIGRVILFLLSLKYPNVSKCFLYFEVLNLIIESFMPYDITFNIKMWFVIRTNIVSFVTDYFHALPAAIVLCLQFPVIVASRAAFYNEPVNGEVVMMCLACMVTSASQMWGMHVAITNCGMIAVEAEILRSGND